MKLKNLSAFGGVVVFAFLAAATAPVYGAKKTPVNAAKKTCEEIWTEILNNGSPEFPQKLAQQLVTEKRVYDNPKFLAHLSKDPAFAVTVLTKWYGEKNVKDWQKLFGANFERLSPLLADPGIASRSKQFAEFVKTIPKDQIAAHSLLEIRQKFSDSLGTVTFYRGFATSKLTAQRLLNSGMDAPAYSYDNPIGQGVKQFSRGPKAEIVARLMEHPGISLSVTKSPEIAAGVAARFTNFLTSPFVFELRIPKIEVIDRTELGIFLPEDRNRVLVDGTLIGRYGSPDVESFVFLRIRPEWITGVREYKNPKPVVIFGPG